MRRMRKFAAVMTAAAMLAGLLWMPVGAEGITVALNGTPIAFDTKPELVNGRTMVPMRAVMEAFGCEVGFDDAHGKVTAKDGGKTITLTVGSMQADADGTPVTLDAAPYLKDGRTMVPVRFFAESLDSRVDWDPAARQVIVTNLPLLRKELESQSDVLKLMLSQPYFPKNARKVKMEWNCQVAGDEQSKPITFRIGAEGIMEAGKAELELTAELDASALSSYISEPDEYAQATIDRYREPLSMKLECVSAGEDCYYFRGEGLEPFARLFLGMGTADAISDNTWYQLNLPAIINRVAAYQDMDIDYSKIYSGETLWDGVEALLDGVEMNAYCARMLETKKNALLFVYGNDAMERKDEADGSVTFTSADTGLFQNNVSLTFDADGVQTHGTSSSAYDVPFSVYPITADHLSFFEERSISTKPAEEHVTAEIPEAFTPLPLFLPIPPAQASENVSILLPHGTDTEALQAVADLMEPKVKFVLRTEEMFREYFNLNLASREGCPVLPFGQVPLEYAETIAQSGGFLPLDDYLGDAPAVKAYLDEHPQDAFRGADGKLYALPRLREDGTADRLGMVVTDGTPAAEVRNAVLFYNIYFGWNQ